MTSLMLIMAYMLPPHQQGYLSSLDFLQQGQHNCLVGMVAPAVLDCNTAPYTKGSWPSRVPGPADTQEDRAMEGWSGNCLGVSLLLFKCQQNLQGMYNSSRTVGQRGLWQSNLVCTRCMIGRCKT